MRVKSTQSATSSAVSGSTPTYGAFAASASPLNADERELGLRQPRVDRRDPDRAPEEVLAQPVDEAAQRELRGHVHRGVLVRLPARDRAREQDVALVADVREREPRDPDRAVDVRVQDGRLVLRRRLGEWVAAEREPRVVVEDVDPAELLDGTIDERHAARLVGDVERKRDVRLDPLDAPSAPGDAHSGLAQLAHGRGAEAARGARDDSRLPRQLHGPEPSGRRCDRLDDDRLERPVAAVPFHERDRVGDVLAGRDAAEDRVLAVQPRRIVDGDDEELRAVRVRPGVRHREVAARDRVVVELVLERVAGTTRPVAARATALDHEVRDHAMEHETVVVALAGELREVLDRLRGVVVEELELDRPLTRGHDRRGHGRDASSRRQQAVQTAVPTLRRWRPKPNRWGCFSRPRARTSWPASGAG